MKPKNLFKINAIAAAVIAGSTALPSFAVAEEMVEEIVTTGSRVKARSVTETPAPVDVIQASELANQGDTDVGNLLRNSVPSFAISDQPISDAATLIRPANLRGMAPDHTLVLVNGKRRHRASVITWLGNGISNGSQGPDVAALPTMALKSVEVLRDGASSIYGSDAIAGVINFQLKDASDGNTIELRAGEYSAGDGQQLTIAMNKGMELGADGFVNMTLEYGSSDETIRSVQRTDAAGLVADGYTDVPNPAMIWGRPIVDDDLKFFVNFGADLGAGTEMYGYTNYNSKNVDGGFYFRNPTNRGGVYGDGSALLIGDMTPDDGADCPAVTLDGNTPDAAAMQAVIDDPNCFSFQETIPGGFTPRFGGEITDQAFLFGLKGETDGGLGWDVSTYYGKNKSDFHINNTVNASLGPDTPRNFDPGYYQQVDMNLSADFTYSMSDSTELAFGMEYRTEEFTVGAGQEESYTAGVLGTQGFSTSSNGFPGFPAKTAGTFERSNLAAYVQSGWQASDALYVESGLRFEDFEDFGVTTNYKLGFNYDLDGDLFLRGTYSTGFKAPTPGQSNTSNTSTEIDPATGQLRNNGTIPATSAVALLNGGAPLDPEESTNFTLGFGGTIGAFDFTIDYFDIDVEDRLNLSSEVTLSDADIQSLIDDNVPGAGDMAAFRFFTNDFDTNTSGIDVVISTTTGNTEWNLAYNNTSTDVTDRGQTVDDGRVRQMEETTPDTRWNLSANHSMDNLRVLGRVSYFDDWYDFDEGVVFDGEYIVDVEVAYDMSAKSSVLLGGNNILDNSGDEVPNPYAYGNLYSQRSPFGISGAFWYATYRYNF